MRKVKVIIPMFLDAMKGVKKQHLPQKICITCRKSFSWRKKWERSWDEVKYCSERCSRNNTNVTQKMVNTIV